MLQTGDEASAPGPRFDGLSENLSFENYGFNNQDVF